MPIEFRQANVAYFSVPKCACSSLKRFFFKESSGIAWAKSPQSNGKKTIHNRYPSVAFNDVDLTKLDGLEKVAVVRAPVARLKSCYTSKVLKQQVLHRPAAAAYLKLKGLTTDPDFDTFVAHLDDYRAASRPIKRHSEPLSVWLGQDPSYFDHLFDISELDQLQQLVRDRTDNKDATIPHANKTEGAAVKIEVSDTARQMIEERFETDLAIYGHLFAKH